MPALPKPWRESVRQISRSFSSELPSLKPRVSETVELLSPAHPSTFSPLRRGASSLASRVLGYVSSKLPISSPLSLGKRQNGMVGIPTTYAGLNSGPAPGVVAGIILGALFGFLLCLWLLYTILRLTGYFGTTTIIEEEVIRRRSRSPRRRSRSRSETIEIRSEHSRPRRTRTETIVVEETVSRPADDDIVEVFEEHSPERRPARRESKRTSGFRTVDPAEFGGGDRPMRKVSRR